MAEKGTLYSERRESQSNGTLRQPGCFGTVSRIRGVRGQVSGAYHGNFITYPTAMVGSLQWGAYSLVSTLAKV
ncbi:hypothetical protein GcC1_202031 [Golovinomyces cichoracearum]|uniref:Uncharacterized protein n=1 Tax=Golovinomyces cichoracearum TaxID=62708 RepID=A0A420HDR4_9PEZI|nr:hypothetical protein GcC1_202031 [Golovinomyces cichoracearum]